MPKLADTILARSIGMYLNTLSYIHPKKSYALAYGFFSEPRKGKLHQNKLPKTLLKAKQEIHSYKEHYFQTYTWKGNDEIILLAHGWESNSSRWKKMLPYLKKTGKTIIAIDAPAHGLSSGKEFNVPTYAEYINIIVQKYNPTIVIGHSIGGNAITYFQAHYEHNFEKIILLGAPSDFKIILNNFIGFLGLNSRVHQHLIDYTKQRFNIEINDFSGANFLEKSEVSGIIVHDVDDDIVLFEEAKKLAKSWKSAQLIQTKGLGHSLHENYLYQTISNFIEK